ncbi:MAG: hypothetical protein QOJ64_2761 [Acidobacteriota bacterium]|jgi:hypothetical protein|nr:hypothetical protein [Acidobacteriota bacterium]
MKALQSLRYPVCRAAILIALLILTARATLAQQPPPQLGPPPGATPKERSQDQQSREWRLRNVERDAAQAQVNQQRLKAAIDVVKDDFKRIQIVRNELISDLTSNKPLNHKLIAERTGEINKRAHRLKTFLMPPVPEKQEKEGEKEKESTIELKPDEIKGALIKLCNTIYNFTENPILKTPNVVDVEQSARAGQDLLTVIELSGNIKASAEKLSKE